LRPSRLATPNEPDLAWSPATEQVGRFLTKLVGLVGPTFIEQ
jgi:hypothetical protein